MCGAVSAKAEGEGSKHLCLTRKALLVKETQETRAKRQEMGAVTTGQVTVSNAPSESSSETTKQGNDLIQFLWFCFEFFPIVGFFSKKMLFL